MRASIQSLKGHQQGLMGHGSAGDGMISAHETCISPADFRVVAGFGKRNLPGWSCSDGYASTVWLCYNPDIRERMRGREIIDCLVVEGNSRVRRRVQRWIL